MQNLGMILYVAYYMLGWGYMLSLTILLEN